jgi:predicted protein tyrosine phosphatase
MASASSRTIPSVSNFSGASTPSTRSLATRSNRVLPSDSSLRAIEGAAVGLRSSLRSLGDGGGGGDNGGSPEAPTPPRSSRPPVIFVLAGSRSDSSSDLAGDHEREAGAASPPAQWASSSQRRVLGASHSTLSVSGRSLALGGGGGGGLPAATSSRSLNPSLSLSSRSLPGGGLGAALLSGSGRAIVVPSGERAAPASQAGALRRAAAARSRWRAALRVVRAAVRFRSEPARAGRAAAEAAAAAKLARVLSRAGRGAGGEAAGGAGAGAGAAAAAAAGAAGGGGDPAAPPLPLVRAAIACCGEAAARHVVSPSPGRYPSFITPALLIGSREDAADAFLLKRLGVTHVLNVAAHLPTPREVAEHFVVLHLPLADTPEQEMGAAFGEATAFIAAAAACGGRVLVHCVAGISRSVAVTLAYFTCPSGGDLPLRAAWALVKRRRAVALPNTGFRVQLALFEVEVRGGRSSVADLAVDEWDIAAWRAHPERLRLAAIAEEAARENARLGVHGRAAKRAARAWAAAKAALGRAWARAEAAMGAF